MATESTGLVNYEIAKGLKRYGAKTFRHMKKLEQAGKKTYEMPASAHASTLRASLVPGTVLILLKGHFKGKRVVYLKQMESGLLLVSGPYKVNGVPLRRVNPAYVIATSTHVDVSSVDIPEAVNDKYFQRKTDWSSGKRSEKNFFQQEKGEKVKPSEERVKIQVAVDDAILKEVAKTPMLKEYLAARFSLGAGQYPHSMKF